MTSFRRDVAQVGDALALLRSLPDQCARLVFFDPQFRQGLDRLQYGNEGERQGKRHTVPAMTGEFIDDCCIEIARVLMPSAYLMRWEDSFQLVRGLHLNIEPALASVSLIAWDSDRMGMGYRARHRGDYLVILQKPPIKAKSTWRDHGIPDRWVEKTDRKLHPHIKPIGLISRLIGAVSEPGELVVDPAAGSFGVMQAARNFIGCDISYGGGAA